MNTSKFILKKIAQPFMEQKSLRIIYALVDQKDNQHVEVTSIIHKFIYFQF